MARRPLRRQEPAFDDLLRYDTGHGHTLMAQVSAFAQPACIQPGEDMTDHNEPNDILSIATSITSTLTASGAIATFYWSVGLGL
jgi:hypothetical protein